MSFDEERAALLERGDRMWELLRAALEAHLEEPLAPDVDWTGHDVYAHFARWQADSIDTVRKLSTGQPWQPREEHEDVLNVRWREEDKALPTQAARKRCLETRTELRSLLVSLNETQWRLFGLSASADISGQHYDHHLRDAGVELPV